LTSLKKAGALALLVGGGGVAAGNLNVGTVLLTSGGMPVFQENRRACIPACPSLLWA